MTNLETAAHAALEAMKGVVRVADRKTVEFDAARSAITALEGALAEAGIPATKQNQGVTDPAAIRRAALEEAAAHLDALAEATPLGHEDRQRGASTYNWLRTHAAVIRALADKEPTNAE